MKKTLTQMLEEQGSKDLAITKAVADKNYYEAGKLVKEDPDEINVNAHGHLLCDTVHLKLLEVLEEVQLPFHLSDFQKISLHVIGSKRNLILIRETIKKETPVNPPNFSINGRYS